MKRETFKENLLITMTLFILIFFLVLVTMQCAKSNFATENTGTTTEPPVTNSTLTYPVTDTGQSDCYNEFGSVTTPPATGARFNGQDAQYQGIQMAFKDNGDGTVSDLNTGLMWQKTPDFTNLRAWTEATPYAESLTLAGYSDWRLPTMKELYSIAAFYGNQGAQIPYIDTDYFDFQYPDTSNGMRGMDAQYWVTNRYVGITMYGDQSAFGFNFADGRIKAYPISIGNGGPGVDRYVRCVRGNTDYGKNKFKDNSDGTITDEATGLMWMKKDSSTTMNWEQALSYSENLDYAGYTDWRLPNAKELQSIVDYSRAPDASDPAMRNAAIDPVFDITEMESWFWTGTTHGDHTSHAIYISFGRGLSAYMWNGDQVNAHGAGCQRTDPKSGNPDSWPNGLGPQGDEIRIYNYVRCVRNYQ